MTADWLVDEVRACRDCSVRPDGRWAFCGWHENVAAAVKAVARSSAFVTPRTETK